MQDGSLNRQMLEAAVEISQPSPIFLERRQGSLPFWGLGEIDLGPI